MIEKILSFESRLSYPEIKAHWKIVSRDKVKCICPWTMPQLITIYSEETDRYLENISFRFRQIHRTRIIEVKTPTEISYKMLFA